MNFLGRATLPGKPRIAPYMEKFYCPEFYEVTQQYSRVTGPKNQYICGNCSKKCHTNHCLLFHEEMCKKEWRCELCGYNLSRDIVKLQSNIKLGMPSNFSQIVEEHICGQETFCKICFKYLRGPNFEGINHQCSFFSAKNDKYHPRIGFLMIKTHKIAKDVSDNYLSQTYIEEVHGINFIFESTYGIFSSINFLDENLKNAGSDYESYKQILFQHNYHTVDDHWMWNNEEIKITQQDIECLKGRKPIEKFLEFIYNNAKFKNTSILSFESSR